MTDQILSTTQAAPAHRVPEDDVSTTVLIELADRTNSDVTALPPLYETIDPDALDRLVADGHDDLEIAFDYVGHRITVHGDGSFEFERRDDEL